MQALRLKPGVLSLACCALLLPAAAVRQNGVESPVAASSPGYDVWFAEREQLRLRIPSLQMDTALGYAAVRGGRIDRTALHHVPALISSAAGSSLRPIGRPGASLILGHRQWAWHPLIFARLNELENGDPIIVYNRASALTYTVYRRYESKPEEVWDIIDGESAAAERSGRSCLILATCAPYGQNRRRLLVFAARKVGVPDGSESGGGHPGS